MSLAYNGSYSNNVFDAKKRYRLNAGTTVAGLGVAGGLRKAKAFSDSEAQEISMASDSFIRQLIKANYPDGSSINNGFKIVEASPNTNDFLIKGGDGTVNGAGILFIDGYILFIKSDYKYSQQNSSGALTDDSYTQTSLPVLTTPGSPRTDIVYVDFYFAEVSADTGSEYHDTSLIITDIGASTANRLRMVQDIRVAEGGSLPSNGTDGNGIYHRYVQIATLNRVAGNASILTAMITDNRILINPSSISDVVLVNNEVVYGNYNQSANLVFNGTQLGIGTTSPQAALHVQGDIVGKSDGTSNLGSVSRRFANVYMASNIDYASNLTFSNSGVKMTLSTGGNLGIGTTATIPLYVAGAATFDGLVGIGSNVTIGGNLTVNGTTTTINTTTTTADVLSIIQTANANALSVALSAAGATATVMPVTNAGGGPIATFVGVGTGSNKVGIGTVSPYSPLHVYGVTATYAAIAKFERPGEKSLYIRAYNTDHIRLASSGFFTFDVNAGDASYGTEVMRIDGSGNVGIGTINPGSTLQVNGGIVVTSGGNGSFAGTSQIAAIGSNNAIYSCYDTSHYGIMFTDSTGLATIYGWNGGYYNVALCPLGGKVGIGTNNPIVALNVTTTSGDSIVRLQNLDGVSGSRTWDFIGNSGGPLSIYDRTSNKSRVTIDNSGNVGISTTSPDSNMLLTVTSTVTGGKTGISVIAPSFPALNLTTNVGGTPSASIFVDRLGAGSGYGGLQYSLNIVGSHAIHISPNGGFANATTTTFLPSGAVGIGSTSPQAFFQVFNSASTATSTAITSSSSTGGAYTYFQNANSALIGIDNNTGNLFGITGELPNSFVICQGANLPVQFGNNNIVRMTITAGGNIGIGTTNTNPVYGVGANVQVYITNANGSHHSTGVYDGTASCLELYNKAANGLNQGAILTFASNYNPSAGYHAAIKGACDFYANDGSGNMQFFTAAAGAANNLYERMRITSSGSVGIGTTSPRNKLDIFATTQIGMALGNLGSAIGARAAGSISTGNTANLIKTGIGGLVTVVGYLTSGAQFSFLLLCTGTTITTVSSTGSTANIVFSMTGSGPYWVQCTNNTGTLITAISAVILGSSADE
jgi:hypothetical protein